MQTFTNTRWFMSLPLPCSEDWVRIAPLTIYWFKQYWFRKQPFKSTQYKAKVDWWLKTIDDWGVNFFFPLFIDVKFILSVISVSVITLKLIRTWQKLYTLYLKCILSKTKQTWSISQSFTVTLSNIPGLLVIVHGCVGPQILTKYYIFQTLFFVQMFQTLPSSSVFLLQ